MAGGGGGPSLPHSGIPALPKSVFPLDIYRLGAQVTALRGVAPCCVVQKAIGF